MIKFGTDGWRAIIAKEFTVENVNRVAQGIVKWIESHGKNKTVVLGYDCRFGGRLFASEIASVLSANEIEVLYSDKGFVSTPMVSYGVVHYKSALGVILTASHNPSPYNGVKLKSEHGGPLSEEMVKQVEGYIPSQSQIVEKNNHFIKGIDLEAIYIDKIKSTFDIEAIKQSNLRFAYHAMYGAGQRVLSQLFPSMVYLGCEWNPNFGTYPPEPIAKNLPDLSKVLQEQNDLKIGVATDGDADRIGLFDENGEFVDAHLIILLLVEYLYEEKNQRGKVVVSCSTTPKIKRLCEELGLEYERLKVGFKYISSKMVEEEVMLGGEESGGIALCSFIPERDGIWIALTILSYMAKKGLSLRELVQNVHQKLGAFGYHREDLHLSEADEKRVKQWLKDNKHESFGDYKVCNIDKLDGYKYEFEHDKWLMFRFSGTEPLIRIYAEGQSLQEAKFIIQNACRILNITL